MRIRHPLFTKAATVAGAFLLPRWMRTLHFRVHLLDPNVDPFRPDSAGRFIYTFWHENLLLPAQRFAGVDVCALVSQHADGELIAGVCRRLGFAVVRGSTSRGGVAAVRQLLQAGRHKHLAVTPDGPRGPRRQAQPGVVYLASQLRIPIVPVGFGYRRCWRLRSWDRLVLPRLRSTATCVFGPALDVATGVGKNLTRSQDRLQKALDRFTVLAEEWAGEDIHPRFRPRPDHCRVSRAEFPHGGPARRLETGEAALVRRRWAA